MIAATAHAQTTLLPFNSAWKYRDDGSNQGTAWKETAFNDASWSSGNAQLGYGDNDEATVVSYGNNPKKKNITTYFRKTITVTNAAQYISYVLNLKRDDGAIVYINGVERFRSNMSSGSVSYNTKAASEPADDGNAIQTATLPAGAIVSGTNVIAVEIHQSAMNGDDISFDLQLLANAGTLSAALTRGPYLQMVNENAATLRWRSDIATDSKIEIGTSFGNYTVSATNATVTTDHEVRITGLNADTKYYYRFGSSTQVLQSATDNFFNTAPPVSASRKIRIAAFGDCGRNDNGFQSTTLDAYRNFVGSNPAELLLLLGDNAYDAGLDNEYQSNFFNAYSGNILKNHALFTAPGNHDYANNATRQNDHNIPYYSIFTMPAAGECGGLASNTEAFYSFNWGNIHFLSLDSYGNENNATRLYDTAGAQVQWIKRDLAANTRKWVIAYWHHPPFTMGSHNSDTESELVNIRNNFIRILERNGVDLVICGHSHNYERSYLLRNYFGTEASFTPSLHTVTTSSGMYNGTANSCPYTTQSGQVNHGTVYVVAGSAGADGGIQAGYPHNALPFSVDDGGMFYFEVEDNRLDAKFIRRNGTIADNFTIAKDVRKTSSITIAAGSSVDLTASWIGNYNWTGGEQTRTITVAPATSSTYVVNDLNGCLSDTFNITVSPAVAMAKGKIENSRDEISVVPTLVKRGQSVLVKTTAQKNEGLSLTDANGQLLKRLSASGDFRLETNELAPGVYFLQWLERGKIHSRKFVVVN